MTEKAGEKPKRVCSCNYPYYGANCELKDDFLQTHVVEKATDFLARNSKKVISGGIIAGIVVGVLIFSAGGLVLYWGRKKRYFFK